MSLFLFNFKFNKMLIEIKTEEITKVVEKRMTIGEPSYYNRSVYANTETGVTRTAIVEDRLLQIEWYTPKIKKNLLGWGCHSVKPAQFKKILKAIKTTKGVIQGKGECDFKITSMVGIVKLNDY